MEGIAADWYRDQEETTWEAREARNATDDKDAVEASEGFEEAFIMKFTSPSQLDWAYKRYNELVQGTDTIEEFAHKFRELRRKVDPTNAVSQANVLREFMIKMNPQLRILVQAGRPDDIEDAISSARTIEASMKDTVPSHNHADITTAAILALTQTIAEVLKDKKEPQHPSRPRTPEPKPYVGQGQQQQHQGYQNQWRNPSQGQFRPYITDWTKVQCNNCNQYGHGWRRCPQPPKVPTGPFVPQPVQIGRASCRERV